MSAKHTSGPWFCKFDDFDEELHITSAVLEASNMVEICRVGVGFDQPFEAEQQANARLIAAAPELLAALLRLLLEFDFMVEGGHIPDVRNDVIFDAARAAIAKAKGTP
jgi:hypothetical protein